MVDLINKCREMGEFSIKEEKDDNPTQNNTDPEKALTLESDKLSVDAASHNETANEYDKDRSQIIFDIKEEKIERNWQWICSLSSENTELLSLSLKKCNDKEMIVEVPNKTTNDCSTSADVKITEVESSDRSQSNSDIQNLHKLEKKTERVKDKFQCSQCNFKTRYKRFWKLHQHVHLSDDSVVCHFCNITFLNERSLLTWHAKNSLKGHVDSTDRALSGMKKKFDSQASKRPNKSSQFRRLNKPQVRKTFKKTIRKPISKKKPAVNHSPSVTVNESGLAVVKNEPVAPNQQENSVNIAHRPASERNLIDHNGKVCHNMNVEGLFCDDVLSEFGFLERKHCSFKVENPLTLETGSFCGIPDGSKDCANDEVTDWNTNNFDEDRDKNLNHSKNKFADGNEGAYIADQNSNDALMDGSTNDEMSGNNKKDFNNNEFGHQDNQWKKNSEHRDENNNTNNDSGRDGDEGEKSSNEESGSPKNVKLLICLVCQTSFSDKVLLIKHLVKVHNLTNLCRICYFRDYQILKFANPVSLRNHRLKCHEKEMKRCICGTLFIDDKTLLSHQKKFRCAEIEIPKFHKCICGKRFSTEKGLNSHKILKCRKRKSTDPAMKTVSKDDGKKAGLEGDGNCQFLLRKRRCASEPTDLEEITHESTKGSFTHKGLKKMKTARGYLGSEMEKYLDIDQNNNVMIDKPKEVKLYVETETHRQKIKNANLPASKPKLFRRQAKENKTIICKTCTARVKPFDTFYHQKICPQKRTGTDVTRKVSFNSDSLKKFRCCWCRFVAVHWKTVLYHHYSNHQQYELDVAVIKIAENPFSRIKSCSVVLERI